MLKIRYFHKKVVDLIPNGRNIRVKNCNKVAYLDSLAQHRLVNSVEAETQAFLKVASEIGRGVREGVPFRKLTSVTKLLMLQHFKQNKKSIFLVGPVT